MVHLILNFDEKIFVIDCLFRSPSTSPSVFRNNLSDYLTDNKNVQKNYVSIFSRVINIDILDQNLDYTQEYLIVLSRMGYISVINEHKNFQK